MLSAYQREGEGKCRQWSWNFESLRDCVSIDLLVAFFGLVGAIMFVVGWEPTRMSRPDTLLPFQAPQGTPANHIP